MAPTTRSHTEQPTTDPTLPPGFPPVRIVSGVAFELVAELAAFASGPARASLESGKTWIREVRRLAGPDLIRRVERWAFGMYAELAAFALETAAPHDPKQLIDALRALPPDVVRRRLLGAESAANRSMVSDDAFERGLAGDPAARAELRVALGPNRLARQSVDRLLTTSSEGVQLEIAAIVEAWASRVFPAFATNALAVIRHDVDAKERLFDARSARDALRVSTNGVDFDPAGLVQDIVVVPTVALRPFVARVEFGSTQIFLCSVADEAFDDDPGAPPRRLVKLAAALGDELRLRILYVLADDELTASEIADRLGVLRTSLYHHLGILRSAGLLTIHDDGIHGWRYARRADGIGDVGTELTGYLDSTGRKRP
jgi:DNA-binding transcriptional ArsR family regulator